MALTDPGMVSTKSEDIAPLPRTGDLLRLNFGIEAAMGNKNSFDIFRGNHEGPFSEVTWLECIDGFEVAEERMKEFAAERPGPYFVFSIFSGAVWSSIDTTLFRET